MADVVGEVRGGEKLYIYPSTNTHTHTEREREGGLGEKQRGVKSSWRIHCYHR